jgi:hypothetical protein
MQNQAIDSSPNLLGFNPYCIPYQGEVVDFLHNFDYGIGNPEILLSGSYGSAKSILMAHLAVVHCLENPGARCCLARKAMPDLKRTIFKEVIEHIEKDLTEGVDYIASENRGFIKFANGSECISISWADKKYKKGRSLKLSMIIFEELTENNDDDFEAFKTLKARLRRIVGIKQNILIAATNPDEPSHWVYDYFIEPNENGNSHPTREVFYSVTTDNPFLDPVYIQQLEADLTAREVLRFIYGKWISLKSATIYYEYDKAYNHSNSPYNINEDYPIICTWDFNIGDGKPMSLSFMQFINDHFHIFDEVILHGSRTLNTLEEALGRGILNKKMNYIICGDASGKARDTRSNRSDWQIIKDFFEDEQFSYEYKVPRANPPIKTRHNRVNAYFKNSRGERRITIYQKAKMTEKGFRLTKLKAGGVYIEDDSKEEQHVTTAVGYAIVRLGKKPRKKDNTGTTIL